MSSVQEAMPEKLSLTRKRMLRAPPRSAPSLKSGRMRGGMVSAATKMSPVVRVVAVSACAYDRDGQKALDAGASEYLSKPLNGERLRQTLRELLSEE